MCRSTHVLWFILDEELDSHGYFTFWLHLNEKNRKSIQGQVKKVKKRSNFQNLFFLKQRRVSEAESPQQSNIIISFPVSGLKLSKNGIWMYDVIIGHYGENKNIPFGGQKLSYRVENLHTGWRPQALQHIFRFFENFENFGFCDHFSKKSDFLKFLGSKKQNLRNPR